jgi:hypothetical protein
MVPAHSSDAMKSLNEGQANLINTLRQKVHIACSIPLTLHYSICTDESLVATTRFETQVNQGLNVGETYLLT